MTDLDYSAARIVRDLLGELKAKNVGVAFARVTAYLRRDVDGTASPRSLEKRGSLQRFTRRSTRRAPAGLRLARTRRKRPSRGSSRASCDVSIVCPSWTADVSIAARAAVVYLKPWRANGVDAVSR